MADFSVDFSIDNDYLKPLTRPRREQYAFLVAALEDIANQLAAGDEEGELFFDNPDAKGQWEIRYY